MQESSSVTPALLDVVTLRRANKHSQNDIDLFHWRLRIVTFRYRMCSVAIYQGFEEINSC